ncbi:methyltransferase domain-containing protein [Streptomyces sp. CC208A]|uniref:methyltransferase domain-containing protein n=1 Tax=Streptomyces sp. CC208A TaxID=3044573 RepID=UPI0024A863E1|nr:methyltransferase domain-containing protein [Streptomyces sp. CC208A]
MSARVEEAGPDGLASALVASGALQTDWLPTYRAVPRAMFVPDRIWPGNPEGTEQRPMIDRRTDPRAWLAAVCSDRPLTTQWDAGEHRGDGLGTTPTSSSSLPSIVFEMLADLDVEDGHRVLEIGTGTGWNAALLSHRLGARNVVTVEYGPTVAAGARQNLTEFGIRPLVHVGDGREGFPDLAPYDRVIATCSVGELPSAWREQTVPDGVIVAPWGPLYGGEAIARLVVDEEGAARGRFTRSSAFMRLRQQRPELPGPDVYFRGRKWPADGVRGTTELSPLDVGGWAAQFVIGLQVPGAFWRAERYDGGAYTLWTYDIAGDSWASTDFEPGAGEFEVVQEGPRRLWDEVEAAYRWWDGHGRPALDRFGLTVGPDSTVAWLDDESCPVPGAEWPRA